MNGRVSPHGFSHRLLLTYGQFCFMVACMASLKASSMDVESIDDQFDVHTMFLSLSLPPFYIFLIAAGMVNNTYSKLIDIFSLDPIVMPLSICWMSAALPLTKRSKQLGC